MNQSVERHVKWSMKREPHLRLHLHLRKNNEKMKMKKGTTKKTTTEKKKKTTKQKTTKKTETLELLHACHFQASDCLPGCWGV